MSIILALDLGTSAVKCAVMNEQAQILQITAVTYPSATPAAGWIQQNPEDWIKAAVEAIESCLNRLGRPGIDIISLSGHMSGLVLVDEAGNPVHPCITLADSRSSQQVERIKEQAQNEIYQSTGNPVINAFLLPKLLWVKENCPTAYRRAQHVLFPKDYLRWKLTGKFATDRTDAGNSLFFDFRKGGWNEALLTELGLSSKLLPEILQPYQCAGWVTGAASRLFGLQAGIPVAAGAADMAALAVGYGLNEPGDVGVTIGTSATILTVVPEINPIGRDQLTFHPHATAGKTYALGSHFSGGMSLNWFAGLFSGDPSRADYALIQTLSQEAAAIPPGSEGLLYLPFLAGSGTPYFEAEARGSFLGLSTNTKRETMFHAVLEGIAYNLKESLLLFQKMGIGIRTIRAGGGGMNVGIWPAILSDVFGDPLSVVKIADASAIGAALIGGFGAGIFSDLDAPARQITAAQATVTPNEAAFPIYQRYFELYQKSYQNLKEICRGLRFP